MGLRDRLRRDPPAPPPDPHADVRRAADPADLEIAERCLAISITSIPRMLALIDAVRYCVRREVPGDFAECGVWRGGSVLAMILTLQALGAERDIHLYDTFEAMPEPSEVDVSPFDPPARETWQAAQGSGRHAWPEYFDPETFHEQGVRETLLATGYPEGRLHFVRGKVEETIPARAPGRLSLLRLDTDWYESTRHELEHLYPRLSRGGVLIVDDYGHWEGARRAVDEYFADDPVLLGRVDYTARMAVKP